MGCFPLFSSFEEGEPALIYNWNALRMQIEHPFTPLGINSNFHAGQIGRRLTLPVLAHLLHLKLEHLFLIQFISLPFFLRMGWQAVSRVSGDKLALWATLGLSTCFIGQTFWLDNMGNFDCYCYLFMAGVLIARRDIWAALWLFLALFCDERAILLSPVLIGWRQFEMHKGEFNVEVWPLKWGVWLLGGVVIMCLALREWLKARYGLGVSIGPTVDVGIYMLKKFWQTARYGLVSAFELGWVAIGLLPIALYRRNKLAGIGMGIFLAGATTACLCVIDQSRSVSYLFPTLLMGWVAADRYLEEGQAKTIAAFAALTGLLMPPVVSIGPLLVEPAHGYFVGMWTEIGRGISALLNGLPR